MKLAILQAQSPSGDADGALAALEAALGAAAAGGAAMLVAPELFLPGYNCRRHGDLAQPLGGAWCEQLSQLCRASGCGLVVGLPERSGGSVYNTAIALDARGRMLAHYRKRQLFGAAEAAQFARGERYRLFAFEEHVIGLLICYDVEFAEHVRALRSAGADLIVVPTANMLPFTHVPDLLVPARAAEMAVSIAYANYCGAEGDLVYSGGSAIVGPDGAALARAGTGPAFLIADTATAAQVDAAKLSTQVADFRPLPPPDSGA